MSINKPKVIAKARAKPAKKPVLAYHFVGEKLRDGKPIPVNGRWISRKDISMCNYGLHASLHPFDALRYAPGETLCLVEMGGKIEYGHDKLGSAKAKDSCPF